MTVLALLDAVNRRLVERWPDRTVYVDVCPVDFERPSFWLAVEEQRQEEANRFLLRRWARLRLTLYDQVDDHYDVSWRRLAEESGEAMALLTPPLRLEGRAITLRCKALPREADRAVLQLEAEWLEPRATGPAESAPAADQYHIRVETVKTEDKKKGTSDNGTS